MASRAPPARSHIVARQPSPGSLPRTPHAAAPRRRPTPPPHAAAPALLHRFGLTVSAARGHSGHIVSHVEPGTPAAAAGVRAGDLLVEVAGHALSDGDDFRHHLPSRDSDQVVQLRLWRASEVMAPLQRAATLISSISTLRSATKVTLTLALTPTPTPTPTLTLTLDLDPALRHQGAALDAAAAATVAQLRVLGGAPWLTAAAITAAALTAAACRRTWLHRGRHLGCRLPRGVRLDVRLALLAE